MTLLLVLAGLVLIAALPALALVSVHDRPARLPRSHPVDAGAQPPSRRLT